jgi:secreted trypsin-like serine protease
MNFRLSPARKGLLISAITATAVLSQLASAAPQPKIINGTVANLGEVPWQVALFKDPNDVYQSQYCGGTLIDASHVITAAHCEQTVKNYIAAGIIDLNNVSQGQIREVRRWIVHPNYDPNTMDNDIAVLELVSPLDLQACGSNCRAINYITPSLEPSLMPVFTEALISGWGNRIQGLNEENLQDFPNMLEYALVFTVDCLDGTNYSASEISSNMFCAGANNYWHDTCQGDSGGPFVVNDGTEDGVILAGVVSWGTGCAATGYPGVYTRVANYTSWLSQNIGDSSNDTPDDSDDIDDSDDSSDDDSTNTSSKKKSGSLNMLFILPLIALCWSRKRFFAFSRKSRG